MLMQMGANPKAIDKVINRFQLFFSYRANESKLHRIEFTLTFQTGHSAEFYLNHEEAYSVLSHAELLKSFGANENLVDDMLIDQGFCSI